MQISSVIPCPECNRTLEPVHSAKSDLLGYFCLNILNKSCTYINVQSTTDYEHGQRYTTPIQTSGSNN